MERHLSHPIRKQSVKASLQHQYQRYRDDQFVRHLAANPFRLFVDTRLGAATVSRKVVEKPEELAIWRQNHSRAVR